MTKKFVIIAGAGAFGTAMALTCRRAGHRVIFLSKNRNQVQEINENHTNTEYFKNLQLPSDIAATDDVKVLQEANALIVAIPTQCLSPFFQEVGTALPGTVPVVLTNKGIIDHDPFPLFPADIVKIHISNPVAILSGPNFAVELVDNLPAATSLALDPKTTYPFDLRTLFAHPCFRIYSTNDLMGTQVAGVVKNILAIGCGVANGKALGANATAALMTRGLAEMTRLGIALGGKMETFLGLAGVGDLTLTCSSLKSRNFSLGVKLAQGHTVEGILNAGHPLCEGYYSLEPVLKLAQVHKVDMPLCEAIKKIIDGIPLDEVMKELFDRPCYV